MTNAQTVTCRGTVQQMIPLFAKGAGNSLYDKPALSEIEKARREGFREGYEKAKRKFEKTAARRRTKKKKVTGKKPG